MSRIPLHFRFALVLCIGGMGGWFLRGARDVKTGALPAPIPPPTIAAPVSAASPLPLPIAFKTGKSQAEPHPSQVPEPRLTVDLAMALQEGTITAEFRGNARDRLRMMGTNHASRPVRLSIPSGQAFESANGFIVILRARTVDFAPGETRLEDFATVAISSTNRVADGAFVVSPTPQPKLQPFLEFISEHPEVSTAAAQTAALAILENLPAITFAKFAEAGGDLPSQWDTSAFKVETVELVQALVVLRQMGLPDEQLAITVDPQTKIEAMIDPLAHAVAMRYYGIKPQEEWAYWKHELLEGDPSTRHYALHGIARYYPDIALPMLPGWAREARTSQVFRLVAIQALAETERPEALPILKGLEQELGPNTELGKTAHEAAGYLSAVLSKPAGAEPPVPFRITKSPGAL